MLDTSAEENAAEQLVVEENVAPEGGESAEEEFSPELAKAHDVEKAKREVERLLENGLAGVPSVTLQQGSGENANFIYLSSEEFRMLAEELEIRPGSIQEIPAEEGSNDLAFEHQYSGRNYKLIWLSSGEVLVKAQE